MNAKIHNLNTQIITIPNKLLVILIYRILFNLREIQKIQKGNRNTGFYISFPDWLVY